MKSFHFKLLSIFVISCLGFLVYSNTFSSPFHFDDEVYITSNFAIKNIRDLLNILDFYPCRFFTFLSIAFNYHFYQLDVFGYHLFNMAVHLGSAFFVWWLTLLTLRTPAMKENKITRHADLIALFAGLIFVSHPLQTESVTYIWQRAASMAALFYLASLCFYVKSRMLCICHCEEPKATRQSLKEQPMLLRLLRFARNDTFYYICSLITVIMAMFTKELTITLPLMILFYEVSFLKAKGSLNWKSLLPFLLTLCIIPLTILFSGSAQEKLPADHISSLHYFLTQLRVMVTYIRLSFLPYHQNLDYDYPIYKNIFEFPVFISLLFLAAVLYCAKRLFSRCRLVSFSIFWFFLTLLPESSFLPFKDVIVEHRLYLPLVGYSLFLVSGTYYLLQTRSIKTMVAVLMMTVACYSVMTYQRNNVWRDDLTLWNDTVQKSPHKSRPYNNRGIAYFKQNNFSQAMSDYDKAIELDPDYANAYYNRGLAYVQRGNFAQAIPDLNKTIELDPANGEAYNNRGNIYGHQGNLTQAFSDYTRAIGLNPALEEAYNNRGTIYGRQGNLSQAIGDFSKAIELNPKFAAAYKNRGFAYYYEKEYAKAWADMHQAKTLGAVIDPDLINTLKQDPGKTR